MPRTAKITIVLSITEIWVLISSIQATATKRREVPRVSIRQHRLGSIQSTSWLELRGGRQASQAGDTNAQVCSSNGTERGNLVQKTGATSLPSRHRLQQCSGTVGRTDALGMADEPNGPLDPGRQMALVREETMRATICAAMLALAITSAAAPVSAAGTMTGSDIYNGCFLLAYPPASPPPAGNILAQGYCAGAVSAVALTNPRVCAPGGWNTGQAVAAVLRFLDMHPERRHEDFSALALEALARAWPCKKPQQP
jgi:hypothetical protein